MRSGGFQRLRTVLIGMCLTIGITGVLVVAESSSASATGVTLYVDGAQGTTTTCTSPGAAACPTIQDGVNAVESGSYAGDDVTIDVAAGTYDESNIRIPTPPVNSLTIDGAGQAVTTVDGGGLGNVFCVGGGTVAINDLTITDGQSGLLGCNGGGGGAISDLGNLTISDDTFSHDSALLGNGGAVWNDEAITTAVDDTFVDDSSTGSGGAFYAWGSSTLVNDTLMDDTATISGGALVVNPIGGSSTTVAYDTFLDDSGLLGSAIENEPGGSVTVEDSILDSSSCSGTITDGGANVESDDSCGFGGSDRVNNGGIELPGSLAANGSNGPMTLAISKSSSAFDEVPAEACPLQISPPQQPTLTVNSDERGEPRPGQSGQTACDAGAFELQVAAVQATCSSGTSCTNTLTTQGQTVTVTGTKAATSVASVTVSVAPAVLTCQNFSYLAPVTTLVDSGYSGTVLKVTDTVAGLPNKKGVVTCYQPLGASPPAPVLLGKCHGATMAPCQKSVVEDDGSAVVTLQLPPGDPEYHIGGETPQISSFKPSPVKPGKKVTIVGTNLSEVTSVTINGVAATIVKAKPTKLSVLVPSQATSGPVTVVSAAGIASSTSSLSIAP